MFRLLSPLLAGCLFTLAPSVPAAPLPTERPVTARFEGVSLRQAVAHLFTGSPHSAVVLPNAAANPVTLELQAEPWAAAVERVLRAGKATQRREDGVYVIQPLPAVEPAPALAEVVRDGEKLRVRLERYPLGRLPALLNGHLGGHRLSPPPAALQDRPVTLLAPFTTPADLLTQVAAAGDVQLNNPSPGVYRFAPRASEIQVTPTESGELEVRFQETPLRQAYTALLPPEAPLTVSPETPQLPVSIRFRAPREAALRLLTAWAAVQAPGLSGREDGSGYRVSTRQQPRRDMRISAEISQAPLRQSLKLILQGTGITYAVEPTVPDVPITLQLHDVDVIQALRLLTRLAATAHPGVTLRRSENIWIIGLRQPLDGG